MLIDYLIAIFLTLFIVSIIYYYYKNDTWTNPIVIIGAWYLFFIYFDAFYCLADGYYGPGEYNRYKLDSSLVTISLILWTGSFIMFTFGYIFSKKILKTKINNNYQIIKKRKNFVVILVSTFFTLIGFYLIINKINFMGYTIFQLPELRNLIFNKGGYLLVLIQFLPIAIILYFINSILQKEIKIKFLIISSILVSAIYLSIGSRSMLIYNFVLPLLTVYHLMYKKIPIKKIMLIGVVSFFLIVVVFRSLTRDVYFAVNNNLSPQEVIINNVKELPKFIWGGYEASSLDGTIDVIIKTNEFLMGETILYAMVSFIPRSLWKEKPAGGGNTIYTSTYYPSFYANKNAEFSISGVGDFYLNFYVLGFVFFVFFGFIFGYLYNLLRKSLLNNNVYTNLIALIYTIFIFRFFSFLRGDLFNFIGQGMTTLIVILIVYIIYHFSNKRIVL